MKIYRFDDNEEIIYNLKYFKGIMIREHAEALNLVLKERDIGGPMYCKELADFPEQGECGCSCDAYDPSNKKNGRCRYLVHGYKDTDKRFVLIRKGNKFKLIKGVDETNV